MKRHILTVLGYTFATFGTQGPSHFMIFSKHYSELTIMRAEPNFALGFSSMVIQGAILSFVYSRLRRQGTLFEAVKVGWLFGLFLLSYIGLAEAGKYAVPDIASWIGVEFSVGLIQFTLIGVFMGLAHRQVESRAL